MPAIYDSFFAFQSTPTIELIVLTVAVLLDYGVRIFIKAFAEAAGTKAGTDVWSTVWQRRWLRGVRDVDSGECRQLPPSVEPNVSGDGPPCTSGRQ